MATGHQKNLVPPTMKKDIDHLCVIDYYAAFCTLLAVSISGHQILKHLCNFYEPQMQLQIVRILAIIPVSTVCG